MVLVVGAYPVAFDGVDGKEIRIKRLFGGVCGDIVQGSWSLSRLVSLM
jgi:hypothetical protein